MSVSSISHVETFDFASNEYLFAHVTDTLIAVPHRPIIAPRLWPSPLTQRTIAGKRVRTLRRPRIGYMSGASPAQAHRLGADHRAPSASATRRAACTSLYTFSCDSSSRLRARSRKQLPHPAVVVGAAALTALMHVHASPLEVAAAEASSSPRRAPLPAQHGRGYCGPLATQGSGHGGNGTHKPRAGPHRTRTLQLRR